MSQLDWTGETAVIVASGPSAASAPLEQIRGCAKVIAVNNSWQLVPWADILFGCDGAWWVEHRGVTEFKGRKLTSSPFAAARYKMDMFAAPGNNSGLRAIYLAERLKVSPILLVGFDMHMQAGAHWHEPYCGNCRNPGKPQMKLWREEMERVAPKFAARGTKVINCTPGSALKCFPFMPLEEVLNGHVGPDRADQPRSGSLPRRTDAITAIQASG